MAAHGTVPELSTLVPEGLRVALAGRGLRLGAPITGARHGQHRSRQRGSGHEFREHRAYVPGDDPRHLDWRAAARSDRLVLRQSEAEDALRVVLAIDGSAAMSYGDGPGSKWAMTGAIAAAVAELVGRQADHLGFIVGRDGAIEDEGASPTASRDRWRTLARELHEPPSGTCPWPSLVERLQAERRRSTIIVVSDFLDPDGESGPEDDEADSALIEGLTALRVRGHEVALVQLLHPDELEFGWPEDRVIRLEDPRGVRAPIEGPVGTMRAAYIEALRLHLDTLRTRTEMAGLHLVRCIGMDAVAPGLLRLLAELAGAGVTNVGARR